jgi:hypothetical protein
MLGVLSIEVYQSNKAALTLLTRTATFQEKRKILFEADAVLVLPDHPKTIHEVDG